MLVFFSPLVSPTSQSQFYVCTCLVLVWFLAFLHFLKQNCLGLLHFICQHVQYIHDSQNVFKFPWRFRGCLAQEMCIIYTNVSLKMSQSHRIHSFSTWHMYSQRRKRKVWMFSSTVMHWHPWQFCQFPALRHTGLYWQEAKVIKHQQWPNRSSYCCLSIWKGGVLTNSHNCLKSFVAKL